MTDVAAVKVLWDVLVKLVDKGTELFSKGKVRNEKFVEEIIAPLHSTFQRMYQEHLITFDRVRSLLQNPGTPAREIRKFLSQREVLERGSVELIRRVDQLETRLSSDELRGAYRDYVYALSTCLTSPTAGDPTSVAYYNATDGMLRGVERAEMLEGAEAVQARGDALVTLDDIISRLHLFQAQVESEYQDIRSRYAV